MVGRDNLFGDETTSPVRDLLFPGNIFPSPYRDGQKRNERDDRAFARVGEHETDLAALRTNGPRPTPGEAGGASAFYEPRERRTQHVASAGEGPGEV